MERKIVSISSKRQITIPIKYFETLGFDSEAECILQNNSIMIRPVQISDSGAFSEEILADLIAQGYSGQELLIQFKKMNKKIRPAVEELIVEADELAARGGGASMLDVFGTENGDV